MIKEWRLLLLAIGFFTRIPMPAHPDFKETDLNASVKYFPLIGWLVGGSGALIYWFALHVFPIEIAMLLSMIGTIYLTGSFHEDGLTDAIDGLGGGWEKEQVLTIMQDSRIGTYGAVALMLALFLKFETLIHLPIWMLAYVMVAAHSISRLAGVFVIATQEYVRTNGKSKPLATKLNGLELSIAIGFGLLPLLLLNWQAAACGVCAVFAIWGWFSLKLKKRLGGYTGDCLGAMQQLTEIAFYLAVLAWSSHSWKFI